MKQIKFLINLLPVAVMAAMSWVVFQQWQSSQLATRLDYDNPNPPLPTGLSPEPKNSRQAEVINVQSGDTLTVMLNGQQESIRFCGINAPKGEQQGSTESRNYLRSLIAAANNTVIVMVNDTDRQGRKIADVFVSDPQPDAPEQEKFLNYEIVSAGLADIHTAYVESCFNRSLLVQGGREAKQSRRRI